MVYECAVSSWRNGCLTRIDCDGLFVEADETGAATSASASAFPELSARHGGGMPSNRYLRRVASCKDIQEFFAVLLDLLLRMSLYSLVVPGCSKHED